MYSELRPPTEPNWQDTDDDGLTDYIEYIDSTNFSANYDISGMGEYITWLAESENDNNADQSLEWLFNNVNEYFSEEEIDEEASTKPKYKDISTGYLKMRDLNHAVIIRNEESPNIGFDGWWDVGFTITMWVKFLDKTGGGTLFNYGNPLRDAEPSGFTLETFVINKDDNVNVDGWSNPGVTTANTWGEVFMDGNSLGITYDNGETDVGYGFFSQSDVERFIRLKIREPQPPGGGGALRDSHVGAPWFNRRNGVPEFGYDDSLPYDHEFGLMTHTRVPVDMNEWYFIVATYNPVNITEDINTSPGKDFKSDPDFWKWNVNANGTYTQNSGYGAQCKVEIISRTQLLQARGYDI
jgi:hypothetical protein